MSSRDRVTASTWFSLLTSIAVASAPITAQAQVIPDATLGTGNNSVTSTLGNRTDITGGLRRNSSLFHSFSQFNVNTLQQVYFANPAGIRNIFSRVTGGNLSTIDGTLGVAGAANLFLMNPSGIIFGPNARLDISGSFFATTADALEFPDGQRFAATGDRAVPLVEVNIPVGLQFGANPPAMITNRGVLATGQNLTLAAGNLDLQGQLVAGGNLTLNATDTVRVRDTVTEPFLARSGGALTIQGNQGIDILALNHLSQTPFVSGGNSSLISDGIISGDAHFTSGGTFEIKSVSGQLANFTSLYDPIISSAGNVDIAGGYGTLGGGAASLLIESQGSVRIQGNVIIENPDTVSNFLSTAQGDDTVLSTRPGLIIRSGQTNLVYGGTNQNAPPPVFTNNPNIPAGITIAGGINTTNNGVVILDAGANAPINLGSDNPVTPALGFSIFSGEIAIDTNGALNAVGGLSVRRDGPQRSGDISIGTNRAPSSITVGRISTRNLAPANNGGGGRITVNTTGAFTTTGAFDTTDGTSIIPNQPPYPENIVSIASAASNGQSGDISITAGGAITLAAGISSTSNFNGRGGTITLQGASIDTTRGVISSRNDNANLTNGIAGNVNLTATNGDIRTGSISGISNNSGTSGFSGIYLNASQGSIFVNNQSTLSATNRGNYWAGDLILTARDRIDVDNSILESNGYFGILRLETTGGNGVIDIRNNSRLSAAIPEETELSTEVRPDSSITIQSQTTTISSSQLTTTVAGFRDNPGDPLQNRNANGGNIIIYGNTIDIIQGGGISTTTDTNVTGNSGDISVGNVNQVFLPVAQAITLGNTSLTTSANGQGNSGNINILANQTVRSTDGFISTTASGTNRNGIAGDVSIQAGATGGQAIELIRTGIDAAAFARPAGTDQGGSTGSVTVQAVNGGDIVLTGSTTFPTRIYTDTYGNQDTGGIQIVTGSATTPGGRITISNYKFDATVYDGSGRGGDVSINSNGGNITLSGTGTNTSSGIATTVLDSAIGSGGNITITSGGGTITLNNQFQVNSATSTQNPLAASGKGGDIEINSNGGQIIVNGNSTIDASTSGVQTGGNVNVISSNASIQLNSGTIRTTVQSPGAVNIPNGNGGGITISSSGGNITLGNLTDNTGFQINAQTQATNTIGTSQQNGVGGNVQINSNGGTIAVLAGSTINAGTTGTKNSGTVTIQAGSNNLTLDNGTISTSSSATLGNQSGGARSINLSAQNIALSNSSNVLATSNQGIAGNIQIDTQTLSLDTNSNIEASTQDRVAGNISVNAASGTILQNNSRLSVAVTGTGTQAGNITVTTPQLTVQGGAEISASTISGIGGGITLQGINTLTLDNGQISASTATGEAGNLSVNQGSSAANSITLSNGSEISLAATTEGGPGIAGNIFLNTQQLTVGNSSISATTAGSGPAGNLTVSANGGTADSITLSGGNLSVASTGSGDAGNVLLDAQQLTLDNSTITASTVSGIGGGVTLQGLNTLTLNNNSQISASTETGRAGNLTANQGGVAANAITLSNGSSLSLSANDANGDGTAGSIFLNTRQLTVQGNSSVLAGTAGSGTAGNLTVNANGGTADAILLSGDSFLALGSTGSGNAGNLLLDTRQLTLDNAAIAASTVSGTGGGITLQGLNTLALNDGQIFAETATGRAGNVFVTATDAVILNNGSILSVAATNGGTAGNLTINAGDRVRINNSEITVSSPTGQAGNLSIRTNDLRMNRGTIAANTGGGNGANININVGQGLLLMRFRSQIIADAGRQANGGNITINAPFIIGLTFENSDITANAVQGRGGNIDITTNGIFGLQFRPRLTPLSDITASSQFGLSGNVTLNTLNIEPTRGLTPPPIIFTDLTDVAGSACEAIGAKAGTSSELRLTGRGGVPISPTATLPAQFSGSDWVSLELSPQVPIGVTLHNGTTTTLEPGEVYELQATCIRSWQNQQRSHL